MTETIHPLSVFQEMVGAFNDGDRRRFEQLFTDDVTARRVDGREMRGPKEVAGWMWAYREACLDLHVEIVESIVALDRGAAVLRSRGTQTEPLVLGEAEIRPASGRRVTWDACYLYRVRGEQIDYLAAYGDALAFREELQSAMA